MNQTPEPTNGWAIVQYKDGTHRVYARWHVRLVAMCARRMVLAGNRLSAWGNNRWPFPEAIRSRNPHQS